MSLLTLRDDLRAPLEAALPAGTVYYPQPSETVVLPAVVFMPRDPWWRPRTLGTPNDGVRVEFDLQLIVPRTVEVGSALDQLELLALAAGEAMAELGVLWLQLGTVEPVEMNAAAAWLCRMSYGVTV